MQVVVRSLEVLETLSQAPRGMSLQELHHELDIPLASLHRVLATLTQTKHVSRSTVSRRYFPGPATRRLNRTGGTIASRLTEPPAAVAVAAQHSGETVFLTEMVGDTPVCIALAETTHPLRLFVNIGQVMPLHAAASSRAILAYSPEADVRRLLTAADLVAYTKGTPRTVISVLEHLEAVRKQGYDICYNELDEDVWAVSAPVTSADQVVRASVTLVAARNRMLEEETRRQAIDVILEAARELTLELGGDPLPPIQKESL